MIGKKIKKLREGAGMSQEALAEKMEVTRQAVSKWENDISVPDMQNLLKLSSLFDVSMEEWTKESITEKEEQDAVEQRNGKTERAAASTEKMKPSDEKEKFAHAFLILMLIVFFLAVVLILSFSGNKSGKEVSSVQNEAIVTEAQEESLAENEETENVSQRPEEFSGGTEAEISAQTDYLNSPDGVALRQTAQDFAKAYFGADKETAKKYAVIEEENLEVWESDVWDKLDHFVLKWNPEDLAGKESIGVQYEFMMEGEDSYTYLGLELVRIQGVWKVSDVYLEK